MIRHNRTPQPTNSARQKAHNPRAILPLLSLICPSPDLWKAN